MRGTAAGDAFEHFILMELIAYKGLMKKRYELYYWRTKTGLEVDFVINDAEIAIEVKINQIVHKQDIKGLIAFCEEHRPKKAFVVSQDAKPRTLIIDHQIKIIILPWQDFLERLWEGEIL